MQIIRDLFSPHPRSQMYEVRAILERDPDLKRVRQDQKELEVRVSALETQAKVRARRK